MNRKGNTYIWIIGALIFLAIGVAFVAPSQALRPKDSFGQPDKPEETRKEKKARLLKERKNRGR